MEHVYVSGYEVNQTGTPVAIFSHGGLQTSTITSKFHEDHVTDITGALFQFYNEPDVTYQPPTRDIATMIASFRNGAQE